MGWIICIDECSCTSVILVAGCRLYILVLIGLLVVICCCSGCISWYCAIVECYVDFVHRNWVIVAR
jgi:hypothetical protein